MSCALKLFLLISQPILNGFCFNIAHFEALKEVVTCSSSPLSYNELYPWPQLTHNHFKGMKILNKVPISLQCRIAVRSHGNVAVKTSKRSRSLRDLPVRGTQGQHERSVRFWNFVLEVTETQYSVLIRICHTPYPYPALPQTLQKSQKGCLIYHQRLWEVSR